MALEEHVERVRAMLIKKMGGKSYLRPQGLIDALATDLGESPLTVRQCMGRLVREDWIEGVSPDGSPYRQVKIIGNVPIEPPNLDLQRWLSVIDRAGLPEQSREVLAPLSAKLSAFSDSEMGYILDGLLSLSMGNLPHSSSVIC